MKSTGIIRKVDSAGRFVLPAELREAFGIKENGGALELFVDDNCIILKKHEPGCGFCGSDKDIELFKGRSICKSCADEIASIK